MEIKNIKSEFPIFNQKINGKPLVYLDSANSSQKPKCVIDRISTFYENEYSNVGRSVHTLAVKATNRFEQTSEHTVNENIVKTEITSGPATGTIIESFFQKIDSGTQVSIKINLNLGLKYKLFTPIIKKFYKQMLTGVLYKMNREIEK